MSFSWSDPSSWIDGLGSLFGGGSSSSGSYPDGVGPFSDPSSYSSALSELGKTDPSGASWWQGPIGVAGVNGIIGAAQGAFGANAASDRAAQSQQYLVELEKMREAAALQLQAQQAAAQLAAAKISAGAQTGAAKIGAQAKKFGDVGTAYQSYANGLRQTGANESQSYQGLAGLLQNAALSKRGR